MKKSNLWLGAALALLLLALSAYNLGLRAEYRRGTFRDPLRGTTALSFRDFDAVDLPAATALNVRLTAGPYAVRVNDDAAKYLKITQQGRRLTVALVFPEERKYLGRGEALTLSLPRLRELHTGGTYSEKGRVITQQPGDDGPGGRTVRLRGFGQNEGGDSLTLRQDQASRVELSGCRLAYLRAETGRSAGSRAQLDIGPDNRIAAADLRLPQRGELRLATRIGAVRYQVGDSATVTLSGAGLGGLR